MFKIFGVQEVKKGFFFYCLNNCEYWDKVIVFFLKEDFEV